MIGSFDLQVDTAAKRAGIRDAFVVQTTTGKNSWVAGSSNRKVDTTAKRAGIRDALVVELYK